MSRSAPLPPCRQKALQQQALTHPSYTNEHPGTSHYERLEYLGDAVLGFVVGALLFRRYPHFSEKELTRLRAQLVNQAQLTALAELLDVAPLIRLGKGQIKEQKQTGRANPAILCDVFEALIGATFLDGGITVVETYLSQLYEPILQQWAEQTVEFAKDNELPTPALDAKSQLQQWSLQHYQNLPEYQLQSSRGPDHARQFTFIVLIQGKILGRGSGANKKLAQQKAAFTALEKLEVIQKTSLPQT